MRITPEQVIGGIPAVTLRTLFRKLRHASFTASALCNLLVVAGADDPIESVRELLAGAYLQSVDSPAGGLHYGRRDSQNGTVDSQVGLEPAGNVFLELTTLGLALSNASAAKPVKRATAAKALEDFLNRVNEVHHDHELAYDVANVVLFGSYLNEDSPTVGDVDLAIQLERRPRATGETERDRTQRRVEAAHKVGRTFRSFLEEVSWPHDEVMLKLKARSRVLSFVDYQHHEDFLVKVPHRVIYMIPRT